MEGGSKKSNGGLMLPSFVHNQPTVSVSTVSSAVATTGAASPEELTITDAANDTKGGDTEVNSAEVDEAEVADDSPNGMKVDPVNDEQLQAHTQQPIPVKQKQEGEIRTSSPVKTMLDISIPKEKPIDVKATISDGRGLALNDDSSSDEEEEMIVNEKIPEDEGEQVFESDPLGTTPVEDHPAGQTEKDRQIEDEVADEVRKSSVLSLPIPDSETNTPSEEQPVRPSINNRGRTNSIKDIPNPSPNLQKQKSFDFQSFLKSFKSKECEPVHKYLKSFLNQFSKKSWTVEEQIKLIRDFNAFLFNKLIEHEPFNQMGDDELKIANCKEGLEKLVLTRVYHEVFSPEMAFNKLTDSHKSDRLQDRKYWTNLHLYDWIKLEHLDVNIPNAKIDSNFMKLASNEIEKINQYKSPRDKIICILNSSKVIFGFIRQNKVAEENADSFVPLLIYVLLNSKAKNLYSNLKYIERFRNEEFLVGETSYYVSTLEIACNFIIGLNRDQLTIEDEEFNENIDKAKIRIREIQQKKAEENSPGEILSKSAGMMKQSLSNTFANLMDSIDGVVSGSTTPVPTSEPEEPISELERIKQLSIEEHQMQELQHKKQEDVFNNLKSMFTNLEDDLIRDVMASCVDQEGVNVGECVNNLLILGE